jgi:putative acyl-CoA dehydrogenase
MLPLQSSSAAIKAIRKCLSTATTLGVATDTHRVFNQSQPFKNVDLFASDKPLQSVLEGVNQKYKIDVAHVANHGKKSGSEQMMEYSELAEKNRPVLRQFDLYGRRIDVVDYHQSYHDLMQHGLSSGVSGYGFKFPRAGSQVIRAALIYQENQLEPGHCCPLVMTAAGIPV